MQKREKNSEKHSIAIIGDGSWATALVWLLTENQVPVNWWIRRPDVAENFRQHGNNPDYLSILHFGNRNVQIHTDAAEAIKASRHILVAVPSAYLKGAVDNCPAELFKDKLLVSAVKGLVLPENQTVSAYLAENKGVSTENFVHISGPCHAEEVAAEKLSFLTFSSKNKELAAQAAAMFTTHFLSVRLSDDPEGTQYASALKNVYALAAGISVGLGYGDNFRAVLTCRCMKEMKQFLEKATGKDPRILDPAYLGDLLVTAYSQHSRNRSFGIMIGKGYNVKSTMLEMNMVAEGYYATQAFKHLASALGDPYPVLDAVYDILYGHAPAVETFAALEGKID